MGHKFFKHIGYANLFRICEFCHKRKSKKPHSVFSKVLENQNLSVLCRRHKSWNRVDSKSSHHSQLPSPGYLQSILVQVICINLSKFGHLQLILNRVIGDVERSPSGVLTYYGVKWSRVFEEYACHTVFSLLWSLSILLLNRFEAFTFAGTKEIWNDFRKILTSMLIVFRKWLGNFFLQKETKQKVSFTSKLTRPAVSSYWFHWLQSSLFEKLLVWLESSYFFRKMNREF